MELFNRITNLRADPTPTNTDGRLQVEELRQSAKAIANREGALEERDNDAEGEVTM